MRKRALLIGINKYRDPRAHLRGCVNDVSAIEKLLLDNYGFRSTDISKLLDEEATKSNIEAGVSTLLKRVEQGDRAFFFYAGHGTRVHSEDANEADQLDECIMPWEATFDTLIKDNWFNEKLKSIAAAGNAANITLVFDCCHSATLTRDFLSSFDVLGHPSLDNITRNRWFPSTLLAEKISFSENEIQNKANSELRPKSIALGPWDVLSACQDEETAADTYLDGEFRGAFSYSLVNAVRENPLATFQELEHDVIRRVKKNVPSHKQEPHFSVRSLDNSFMQMGPDRTGERAFELTNPSLVVPRGFRQRYSAYAPPMFWGPWVVVGSHGGPVTFSISAEPVGSTVIVGEVRYYDASGNQKVEGFHKQTIVQTGNSWANVEVRFKGVPTGSAVNVTVN